MIDGGSLGGSSHTRGEGKCAGCNFDGGAKWIAGRLGEQDGAGRGVEYRDWNRCMISGNRTGPVGDEEVGTLVMDGMKTPAED